MCQKRVKAVIDNYTLCKWDVKLRYYCVDGLTAPNVDNGSQVIVQVSIYGNFQVQKVDGRQCFILPGQEIDQGYHISLTSVSPHSKIGNIHITCDVEIALITFLHMICVSYAAKGLYYC